jgi:hypothetical protein
MRRIINSNRRIKSGETVNPPTPPNSIIFTDLDGTLFTKKTTMSDANKNKHIICSVY